MDLISSPLFSGETLRFVFRVFKIHHHANNAVSRSTGATFSSSSFPFFFFPKKIAEIFVFQDFDVLLLIAPKLLIFSFPVFESFIGHFRVG